MHPSGYQTPVERKPVGAEMRVKKVWQVESGSVREEGKKLLVLNYLAQLVTRYL